MRFLRALGFTPTNENRGPSGHFFVYDGTHSPPPNVEIVLRVEPEKPPSMLARVVNAAMTVAFPNSGLNRLGGYTMFGSVITLYRKQIGNGGQHSRHAIACFKCGGKAYIVDSNHTLDPIPCRWWMPDELSSGLEKLSAPYKAKDLNPANYKFLKMVATFYVNSKFDKTLVSPSCEMRRNKNGIRPGIKIRTRRPNNNMNK
jgi:hypothetical protein